jgi:hypothetical protein
MNILVCVKAAALVAVAGMYLHELRLPYVERFLFEETGNYLFRLRPSVRPNDSIVADSLLVGIHQIGLEIRKDSNE